MNKKTPSIFPLKKGSVYEAHHAFLKERKWDSINCPKKIIMALVGEVGELTKVFEWLNEEESHLLKDDELQNAKDEIADIFLYLIRLCFALDLDLEEISLNKIDKNKIKYPLSSVNKNTFANSYFQKFDIKLHYSLIEKLLNGRLSSFYGCQQNQLEKVVSQADRTCEILFVDDLPMGVVIYKNHLQNEYHLINALELKTCCLFAPERDSRKGLGTFLYQYVDKISKQEGAQHTFCTVNIKSEESLRCLLKNGYKKTNISPQPNIYLMVKENERE